MRTRSINENKYFTVTKISLNFSVLPQYIGNWKLKKNPAVHALLYFWRDSVRRLKFAYIKYASIYILTYTCARWARRYENFEEDFENSRQSNWLLREISGILFSTFSKDLLDLNLTIFFLQMNVIEKWTEIDYAPFSYNVARRWPVVPIRIG